MTAKRLLPRRPRFRAITAAIFVALVVIYGGVSFMIADGVTGSERKPQEDHPRNYGLSWEDVEFPARHGDIRLSGWYLGGDGQGGAGAPHLIFVHGLNSVRSANESVGLAARLVERGYSVLLFDLRGHGLSEGDQVSGGYYERWDVWGAYDYLVGHRGAVPGKIGILGFSMGGSTAILAAADEPGIRALAADSPFAVASELVAQEAARKTPFPSWMVPAFMPAVKLMANGIYGIDLGTLTPVKSVTQLDYPVLIIHGTKDDRVALDHGERVAASGPDGTILWRVNSDGHVNSLEEYPDEYFERVDAYFGALLK